MQDSTVSLSSMQVREELDGRLARQVQLRGFASIGILEIRLRWFAAAGVLVATWLASTVFDLPLPTLPLYAIGLSMLAYNAILRLYLDRRFAYPRRASGYDYESLLRFYWRGLEREGAAESAAFDRFVKVQLSLDWLAMILLIHFSGGVASPLLFFFVFHLIIASILLSRLDCYLFASLAALAVAGVALLEYTGLIPHVPLFATEGLYQDPLYVAAILVFLTFSLYVSVYLATTLTRDLRQRDEELLRLQQQLADAYLQIQTLYNVTQTASSSLHLHEVLNLTAQSAAQAMQVKACSIMLVGESTPQIETIAATGLSEQYLNVGPVDVERNRFLSQTITTGQPTIVSDISAGQYLQYPEEARAEGIVAMLCVPLTVRQKAEGVICVYGDEAGQFVESDANFLSALASASATAVDNARAYEALEMADRAKSDFVRMVTHEFRSPLSAVQSMLRLLETGIVGPLAEKQQDLVGRSQQRIALLLAVVEDLLELAAGKMELLQGEWAEVNLSDLIARVTELLQSRADEKGIECSVELPEAPLLLHGLEQGLERVMMNLLGNAVKYTPAGGTVTVRAWGEGGQIRLEVSDTGIGIPEEALPRIFSEFYRAKNAKSLGVEGTGLGLVIVKDVVEEHGGEIRVKSLLGEGSTFRVSLPRG
jgi:signal transduction histidine kinase